MAQDVNSVELLIRREIEALIATPLIEAYAEKFGEEAALAVAREVIEGLAAETGKMLKMFAGGDTLEHFRNVLPLFGKGDALEYEIVEDTGARGGFNVTRCKYAEMYKEHGLAKYGYLLSCGRDFALMRGFNPKIKFTRTQTIMEGAAFCDFRFEME